MLGKPVPRLDMPAMVTAQFEFVHNVRVPGMLHGRVVRPPAVGATLAAVDESSVRQVPGFVKVVVKKNFVGVVAEKPWQAIQAARALKATWTPGPGLPNHGDFYDYLRNQKPIARRVRRELEGCRRHAGRGGEGREGDLPPSVSDARVDGHRRAPSRTFRGVAQPSGRRRRRSIRCETATATLLGMPAENVRVIFTRGSGCYGINGADTVSYDAALMSQAVGRPVRVQLTRADEMAWENYGAAFVIDQRVGLDANGNIVAWDYEAWSPTLGGRPGNDTPGNVITGLLAGRQPAAFAPRGPAPEPAGFNNGSNAAPSYVAGCVGGRCGGAGTIRSERVLSHTVKSPFFTGPLRSPARLQNTFAHESFMDEIAAR